MLADKHVSRCPLTLNRRRFLKGLGVSAVAMEMGLFEFASSLMAAAPQTPGKCRIMGAFVRPNVDKYWLGWPGTAYDIKGHQELYTKTIVAAAERLGVALDLSQEPIHNDKTLTAYLEKVAKAAPDGVLLTCMSLNAAWKPVNKFLDTRRGPDRCFQPHGHLVHRPPPAQPQLEARLRRRHPGRRVARHGDADAQDRLGHEKDASLYRARQQGRGQAAGCHRHDAPLRAASAFPRRIQEG